MKQLYANGMTMSQILGFSKPRDERGQVLSNGQMPDQVRHDVLVGGQGQAKADLSILAQVNTSFVPYITSVGKQCLQPMAYGIKLIAVLIFICCLFNNAALAQSHENGGAAERVGEIRPLQVGEKVPEEFWSKEHLIYVDGDTVRQSLDQYRGKLLILDFWATWCASCIAGFPKLERLQSQFLDEAKILLINTAQSKDTPERIEHAFTTYKERYGYEVSLDYLLLDSYFQELFPHRSLPHMVWIDRDGVYRVSSNGQSAGTSSIQSALAGDFTTIIPKNDILDQTEKFILGAQSDRASIYHSLLTHHHASAPVSNQRRFEHENRFVYQILNYPLIYYYQVAHASEMKGLYADAWVFGKDVPSEFKDNFRRIGGNHATYCYELSLPYRMNTKDAVDILSEELERSFGISVSRKEEVMTVYMLSSDSSDAVLTTTGDVPEQQLNPEDGSMFVKNRNVSYVIGCIAELLDSPYDLQLENDYKVDFLFPAGILNYSSDELISLLEDIGVQVDRTSRTFEYVFFETV